MLPQEYLHSKLISSHQHVDCDTSCSQTATAGSFPELDMLRMSEELRVERAAKTAATQPRREDYAFRVRDYLGVDEGLERYDEQSDTCLTDS